MILKFGFLIIVSLFHVAISQNNVSFKYKYTLENDTVNPDTFLTPLKIIRRHGYPAESHIVQSEDGFLLELHRIPYGKTSVSKKSYPVLLHHGLLCSSIDWIINGPYKSLAYRLADEGYDVWLANGRGNTFSRSHISLSPSQEEFWEFSFHEMGVYDLPATIDYILNRTNSKQLIYVGHSLGTSVFYVLMSSRPEYNEKVKAQISLAPVASLLNTKSAFRYLAPYAKRIRSMSDWYYHGAFLEHDMMTKIFSKILCGKKMFDVDVCEQFIIFSLFGKDVDQFDTNLVPLIINNIPAGTSGKNMIHCSQLINTGKFQQYDYGLQENIKRYNSATPPAYNISNIMVPVKFYYAQNDILADPTDVKMLYQHISRPMGITLINYEKFNHVDFLWSIDINRLLNDELIQYINNITEIPDFIEKEVKCAVEERSKNPIVMVEPFDKVKFQNHFRQVFKIGEMFDNLSVLHTNFTIQYSNIGNITEDDHDPLVSNIKRTAKELQQNIEKTAEKVDQAVQRVTLLTKKNMRSSMKELELKLQDIVKKLKQIFN